VIAEIAFLFFVTIAIVVAVTIVASVLSGSPACQIANSVLGKNYRRFLRRFIFYNLKIYSNSIGNPRLLRTDPDLAFHKANFNHVLLSQRIYKYKV
jgi:hypothetical protein